MNIHQFPRQKILCNNKPFSRNLLLSLLKLVYAATPPFTGYLEIAGDEHSLLFLFFFNGAPYAAGRYADSKPVGFSIHEFGDQLARSSEDSLTVTLCETDPVLLKSMLLFLQEEPTVKAPTALVDIEHIVRQIGDAETDALIALCRDKKINFFFFKDGRGALANYSDQSFERPEGMTVDEEMLLYAYQPGEEVQVYIFRNMVTTMADDSALLDKNSLDKLFSVGYPKDRRRKGADTSKQPAEPLKNRRKEDTEPEMIPVIERTGSTVAASGESELPECVLSVETGPLQGKQFTLILPCTIGRSGCDLILNDRLISRRHAKLKMIGNELLIEDLASTNGTRVNGEAVNIKRLIRNDLISIGPVNLRISPV